jgi:hypothetical protein
MDQIPIWLLPSRDQFLHSLKFKSSDPSVFWRELPRVPIMDLSNSFSTSRKGSLRDEGKDNMHQNHLKNLTQLTEPPQLF